MKTDQGFLYSFFEKIVDFLFKYTLFEIVKCVCKIKRGRTAADIYVCCMLVTSILIAVFSRYIHSSLWLIIILCYIVYRIYELTTTLVYNFFTSKQTDDQQEEKRVLSIKRCILIFLINVIEIIHHFITIYICFGRLNKIEYLPSYIYLLKASTTAFVTWDTDAINKIFNAFNNISFIQSLMGIFYTVILLAMLVGNVPKIQTINKN